jgi:hypothetical protein
MADIRHTTSCAAETGYLICYCDCADCADANGLCICEFCGGHHRDSGAEPHNRKDAVTEPPRFPEPDVRQILIPPGLWDVTQLFFAKAGFVLGRVPYLEDDLPTYSLVRGTEEDLLEIMRVARERARNATKEGDTHG